MPSKPSLTPGVLRGTQKFARDPLVLPNPEAQYKKKPPAVCDPVELKVPIGAAMASNVLFFAALFCAYLLKACQSLSCSLFETCITRCNIIVWNLSKMLF